MFNSGHSDPKDYNCKPAGTWTEAPINPPRLFSFDDRDFAKNSPEDNLAALVFQALGAASVAWSEAPGGVFDSDFAKQVGDALLEQIHAYADLRRAQEAVTE